MVVDDWPIEVQYVPSIIHRSIGVCSLAIDVLDRTVFEMISFYWTQAIEYCLQDKRHSYSRRAMGVLL